MTVTIMTTPASTDPVFLADAKLACRVDHSFEDGFIAGLITAARTRIEKALGLCFLTTGVSEWRDDWPSLDPGGSVTLHYGPLLAVNGVQIADALLNWRVVEPFRYNPIPGSWPPVIGRTALSLPSPTAPALGLRLDYQAGFGPTANMIPASLKQAVLALVVYGYDHRDEPEPSLSLAETWLSPWRRVGL